MYKDFYVRWTMANDKFVHAPTYTYNEAMQLLETQVVM